MLFEKRGHSLEMQIRQLLRCGYPTKGWGEGSPQWCLAGFLAYMQMLEVILVKPCFFDCVFPMSTSSQVLAEDSNTIMQTGLLAMVVLFLHRP